MSFSKTAEARKFDVNTIRKDFPILQEKVYGKQLIYFDNAATSQKPQAVIDSLTEYYRQYNSNVHRGIHFLSEKATDAFEQSRKKIQQLINAPSEREVIFTRGCTEGINLIAASFGKKFIQPGDEILISQMEHHSNIVPWQLMCEERGAKLKAIPINEKGELNLDDLDVLLTEKTKLVSLVHISNSLGTINPVKKIIEKAHEKGIPVLLDGAQAVPHMQVDVQELDVDFYAFSGHKMFGPTGIGAIYGKEKWLEQLPPYHGGGEMIKDVTIEKSTYKDIPHKFEAGTPNIADAIALGAAIDYLQETGYENIERYEQELLNYAVEKLSAIAEFQPIGTAENKAAVISFNLKNIHPLDVGTLLNTEGIAIRTGHHCCQTVMDYFRVPATCRASFAFYNTKEEIGRFVEAVGKVVRMF